MGIIIFHTGIKFFENLDLAPPWSVWDAFVYEIFFPKLILDKEPMNNKNDFN